MSNFSVRGVHDIYDEQAELYESAIELLTDTAKTFGYLPIFIPILEKIEVFTKSVGESSDIVSKEMYVLQDRNGENLVLRPEGTASVCRAIATNSIHAPVAYYYHGPMFRYERPQKGRYRQFNQFGVEKIDKNINYYADVNAILLAHISLKKLGIDASLNINTLGNKEDRSAYTNCLVEFFNKNISQLSEISKERLKKNPLRILDSKEESDIKLCMDAPRLSDFLSFESKKFHENILNLLEKNGVDYRVNEKLVRGLDYYTNTIFEFITEGMAVLGGGRYIDLPKIFGNSADLKCIGWACGIERLISCMNYKRQKDTLVSVAYIDKCYYDFAQDICIKLRIADIKTIIFDELGLSKQFKSAINAGANYIITIGEDEINDNILSVKDTKTMTQKRMTYEEFISLIATKKSLLFKL